MFTIKKAMPKAPPWRPKLPGTASAATNIAAIAASMAAAGLPDGFHRAAAEIYRRAQDAPAPDAILTALLSPP